VGQDKGDQMKCQLETMPDGHSTARISMTDYAFNQFVNWSQSGNGYDKGNFFGSVAHELGHADQRLNPELFNVDPRMKPKTDAYRDEIAQMNFHPPGETTPDQLKEMLNDLGNPSGTASASDRIAEARAKIYLEESRADMIATIRTGNIPTVRLAMAIPGSSDKDYAPFLALSSQLADPHPSMKVREEEIAAMGPLVKDNPKIKDVIATMKLPPLPHQLKRPTSFVRTSHAAHFKPK
jgi:hypothetical protein